MNNFGQYLSSLRKQKHMTQAELAEKLGVTNKAVSKWETGEAMPDTALLVPISKIFGVTVDELLNGGEGQPAASEPEKTENCCEDSFVKQYLFTRGKDDPTPKTSEKVCGLVCTFVFFASVGVYLVLGVAQNLWHPYWVLIPDGALLCGMVGVVFDLCNKQKREKKFARGENPYAAAVCGFVMLACLISFLTVGALTGLWHPYWVIVAGGAVFCAITGATGTLITKKRK